MRSDPCQKLMVFGRTSPLVASVWMAPPDRQSELRAFPRSEVRRLQPPIDLWNETQAPPARALVFNEVLHITPNMCALEAASRRSSWTGGWSARTFPAPGITPSMKENVSAI
jgi:hypothetical protein